MSDPKTMLAAAEWSPFLRACRRQKASHTPVWLMRQAGRYMPEYRAMRAKFPFIDLCKRPELAAEVTVMPVERLGVDAAIIFADILLLLEPLGAGLDFTAGEGPLIRRPVRSGEDVRRLPQADVSEDLGFVFDAIRLARAHLTGRVPLIGFSGAPFTLASYLIEGGGSRHYTRTKRLMYRDPGAWDALMEKLSCAVAGYLNGQIAAGAQAVQLFDSWVGTLSPQDYARYVLPHVRRTIAQITPGVPVIHFGTGTAGLLELMRAAGGDVIGLDWRVDLAEAWRRLGDTVGVQGNLDPVVLLAEPAEIRRQAAFILERAAARPGHIFNLGHGVLPQTPVDHVVSLVEAVHDLSARGSGAPTAS